MRNIQFLCVRTYSIFFSNTDSTVADYECSRITKKAILVMPI